MPSGRIENVAPNIQQHGHGVEIVYPLVLGGDIGNRDEHGRTEHPHHQQNIHDPLQIAKIQVAGGVNIADAHREKRERAQTNNQIRDNRQPIGNDAVERHHAQENRDGQQKMDGFRVKRAAHEKRPVKRCLLE